MAYFNIVKMIKLMLIILISWPDRLKRTGDYQNEKPIASTGFILAAVFAGA